MIGFAGVGPMYFVLLDYRGLNGFLRVLSSSMGTVIAMSEAALRHFSNRRVCNNCSFAMSERHRFFDQLVWPYGELSIALPSADWRCDCFTGWMGY